MSSLISSALLISSLVATSTSLYIGRDEMVDYVTAKMRCASSGGQLATFSNSAEWNEIRAIRAEYEKYLDQSLSQGTRNVYGLWIGLDDLNKEGHWQFVDGDNNYCAPSSSTVQDCDDIPQWAPGQPEINNEGANCANVWGSWDGTLDDDICTKQKAYICEFDDNTVLKQHIDLLAVSSGTIYIGRTEEVSYQIANIRCAAFGGQLATFGNDVEWDEIRAIRAEYNSVSLDQTLSQGTRNAYGLWIGFNDLNAEGLWKFVDGDYSYCHPSSSIIQDCDDIPQWAPGQPEINNEGSDCAQVWGSWGGRLDDDICTKQKGYICEFDARTLITGRTTSSRRLLQYNQ